MTGCVNFYLQKFWDIYFIIEYFVRTEKCPAVYIYLKSTKYMRPNSV